MQQEHFDAEEDSTLRKRVYVYRTQDETSSRKVSFLISRNKNSVYGTPFYSHLPFRHQTFASDTAILVPPVHLVFFYAYTFWRGNYFNFFIDHFVKNYGDTTWYAKDFSVYIKLYQGDNLIIEERFPPQGGPTKKEGLISTGFNDLNFRIKDAQTWNHFNPSFYNFSIELLDKEDRPYEYFHETIGFREVRLSQGEIYVNKSQLHLKAVVMNTKNVPVDSLSNYLRSIKVHNFNTVLLSGMTVKETFDLCDAIGLNVIQNLTADTFGSFTQAVEYFSNIKAHPSFIAWSGGDINPSWSNIIRRLDPYRPMVPEVLLSKVAIQNWDLLDSAQRTAIKLKFQTFKFYYIPESSLLKITIEEPFRCQPKLFLKCRMFNGDTGVVMTRTIDGINFEKTNMELEIPFRNAEYKSANTTFEFELIVGEDCYPYLKGDIVALSKYRYVLEGDSLFYRIEY